MTYAAHRRLQDKPPACPICDKAYYELDYLGRYGIVVPKSFSRLSCFYDDFFKVFDKNPDYDFYELLRLAALSNMTVEEHEEFIQWILENFIDAPDDFAQQVQDYLGDYTSILTQISVEHDRREARLAADEPHDEAHEAEHPHAEEAHAEDPQVEPEAQVEAPAEAEHPDVHEPDDQQVADQAVEEVVGLLEQIFNLHPQAEAPAVPQPEILGGGIIRGRGEDILEELRNFIDARLANAGLPIVDQAHPPYQLIPREGGFDIVFRADPGVPREQFDQLVISAMNAFINGGGAEADEPAPMQR